jgi:putative DNA modification/repair radical SAM protein
MDLLTKLSILADAAKYDASCASSAAPKRDSRQGGLGSTSGMGICHSYTPDGRCVSLLKILLTNFCIFDCQYCINRKSSNVQRARFRVAEVVKLTVDFYRRNLIEGLFLSSGIIRDADYTMEQLIAVARRLRAQEGFRGYIHLKTIPDADDRLIELAGLYADRLSINIELPTESSLHVLAPDKNMVGIKQGMAKIKTLREEFVEGSTSTKITNTKRTRKSPRFAPAGQSTQLIVGADSESDRTILTTANALYGSYGLKRVYYSAFSPIPDAAATLPLQPAPLLREHRLYQADWLLRFYGFGVDEIFTAVNGMLSLAHDPKHAWALLHPELFPVDINRASREMLLRVPGLGARGVQHILQARRWSSLRIGDLARMRVSVRKAAPFITTPDHRPQEPAPNAVVVLTKDQQLDMFA